MSKSYWPDARVSVIVLPSGKQGDELEALAKEWIAIGLLGRCIWVRPENVSITAGSPLTVMSNIYEPDGLGGLKSVNAELFRVLAHEDLLALRLVKVRSVNPERETDELQDEVSLAVERYVSVAVPATDKTSINNEATIDLRVMNLITAPTEFSLKARLRWEPTGQGEIIVASPEDRTRPWGIDAFVRIGDRFNGFCLMHIATVAGIWHGLPRASLELFDYEKSGRESVWVSRVFFSGVLTDRLAQWVAAIAADEVRNPENHLDATPHGCTYIENENVDRYVQSMVDNVLAMENGVIKYQRPPAVDDPNRARIGIFKQIGEYLRFAGNKTLQMPAAAFRWFHAKISKEIEASLHGDDGIYRVGVQLDTIADIHDRTVLSRFETVVTKETEARVALNAPARLSELRPTPGLWAGLRDFVFASLDGGSDLSQKGFPLVGDDRRPIFRSPSVLFSYGDSSLQLGEAFAQMANVSSVDFAARDLVAPAMAAAQFEVERIDVARAELQTTHSAAVESLAAEEGTFNSLRSELIERAALTIDDSGKEALLTIAEASKLEPEATSRKPKPVETTPLAPEANDGAEEVAGTESTSPVAEEAEPAVTPLPDPTEYATPGNESSGLVAMIRAYKASKSRLKELKSEIEIAVKTLTDSDERQHNLIADMAAVLSWLGENADRFESKLSSSLSSERELCESDIAAFSQRLNELKAPKVGILVELRKKFHRRILFWWGLVLAIGSAVSASKEYTTLEKYLPEQLYIWLYTSAALAFVLLVVSIAYYRGWSQFIRKVELDLVDLDRIAKGSTVARTEKQRLESLHQQIREVLNLISAQLGNPWQVKSSLLESRVAEVNQSNLPLAMRIAHAIRDDAAPLQVLKSAAIQSIIQPGWRSLAFTRLVEKSAVRLGKSPQSFNAYFLDQDMPHASNGSRKLLQSQMQESELLEALAIDVIKPAMATLQESAISDAKPRVEVQNDNPLRELREAADQLSLETLEVGWDEFLLQSVTRGDGQPDPVVPLSVLGVNEFEIQSGVHENVVSRVILPERLARLVSAETKSTLVPTLMKSAGNSPVDAVVRVDMIGPISREKVHLWTGDRSPVNDADGNDAEFDFRHPGGVV